MAVDRAQASGQRELSFSPASGFGWKAELTCPQANSETGCWRRSVLKPSLVKGSPVATGNGRVLARQISLKQFWSHGNGKSLQNARMFHPPEQA